MTKLIMFSNKGHFIIYGLRVVCEKKFYIVLEIVILDDVEYNFHPLFVSCMTDLFHTKFGCLNFFSNYEIAHFVDIERGFLDFSLTPPKVVYQPFAHTLIH